MQLCVCACMHVCKCACVVYYDSLIVPVDSGHSQSPPSPPGATARGRQVGLLPKGIYACCRANNYCNLEILYLSL